MAQGPARHAGTASPSGAPQDFGCRHPGRMPEDSTFPGAPAAGREDGGRGRTALKQQRWSLPRRWGRSGCLTRTGKSPGGKRSAPASTTAFGARSPRLSPPGSRVTASCSSRCCSTLPSGSASSSCGSFLGSTSSWSAALCRTASFAGNNPGIPGGSGLGPARGREVTTACVLRFVVRTMCAVLGLVARQEDSGLRDHRVRVLISNHVTPFDHNIVNLLTSCSTVSGGRSRECHGSVPWGPAQGSPLPSQVFLGDHEILNLTPNPASLPHMSVFLTSQYSFFAFSFFHF